MSERLLLLQHENRQLLKQPEACIHKIAKSVIRLGQQRCDMDCLPYDDSRRWRISRAQSLLMSPAERKRRDYYNRLKPLLYGIAEEQDLWDELDKRLKKGLVRSNLSARHYLL